MLRSMATSISGLKNHQAMLDVTANNIANVNTYGFKASQMTFKDLLYQTYQGASGPTATLGGTNAKQVGIGMQIDTIAQKHTQGSIAATAVRTDLAIDGDGFFTVTNDVAGLAAVPPTADMTYQRVGNLKVDANNQLVTADGYLVLGYLDADAADPYVPDIAGGLQPIVIDPAFVTDWTVGTDGAITGVDQQPFVPLGPPPLPQTAPPRTVAWIALSRFANPEGLTQSGNNKYIQSANSGSPITGVPGDAALGLGNIAAGALEMSNVDLASEFTDMIRAQRGFQANSRVITTSDEILQELVNLKR